MRERLGVTVGKFYPPHLGHLHLIRAGRDACDQLVVIIAEHPSQSLRGEQRAAWIAEAVPGVDIVVTPDDLPEAPEPWARRALEILGRQPDVAFTSEPYGVPWAQAMGCAAVDVDIERVKFPVSGTMVREGLGLHFESLAPGARRDLATDVVIVGSESTGKTTLAAEVARALGTVWVPEYGREYWVERECARPGEPWTTADFVSIATEHHARGNVLAERSTGITVWDTDALATGVWHRRYLGHRSGEVEEVARAHRPSFYVLAVPDFPFVQDGTRADGPHREHMHAWFREALEASGVPWIEVGGDRGSRLAAVERAVAALPPVVLG